MNKRMEELVKAYRPKDDSSNIKRVDAYQLLTSYGSFTVSEAKISPRLKKVTLSRAALDTLLSESQKMSVIDLEYVAAYRFFLAEALNRICDGKLRDVLTGILHDRQSGALVFEVEGFEPDADKDFDKMLKLSTAVSYLYGKSNLDSMSGKYYARFAVENTDASDSFLRKFAERMTLHNDGSYVKELTDYVLMMKLAEREVKGGYSLLLHLDDWEDLALFSNHPIGNRSLKFSSPPSKGLSYSVHHPIFHQDRHGLPCMSYIDQFVKPATTEEGLYVYALSQSLETSQSVLGFELKVGMFVICNNHFWLHGRDKFAENTKLYRELMRQRGIFFTNLYRQPYPDELERF